MNKKKLKRYLRFFWIFLVGSVIGFLYENILVLIKDGHFELRQGLIYGPFIPVYGIGAVIYEMIVPKIKSPLKIFFYTMFFGATVEYICSYLQEVLFGTISWNYDWVKINFNGRTSVLHAFYWGTAGLIYSEIVHPFFEKISHRELTKSIITVSMIFAVFMSFDILISWSAVMRQKDRLLNVPAKTKIDTFLDTYYPDELIDKIYTNKMVTITRNI